MTSIAQSPPTSNEPTDAQILRDHHDETGQTAVVALPVATWRLVAAAVRYVTEGVAVEHRSHVDELAAAHRAIRSAIEARIPDARDQTLFHDEIADAPDMTPEQKIHWLRIVIAGLYERVAQLTPEPQP